MTQGHKAAVAQELAECFTAVDAAQLEAAARAIENAGRVYVQGKGRMGYVLKAFAARLAAMGRQVCVVGDVSVPPIGPGHLLIVTPTGGDPRSSTRFLQVARQSGAQVLAFTANRGGPVGALADLFIEAGARAMGGAAQPASLQPMCSTLEQAGLLVFDSLCDYLAAPGQGLAAARAGVLAQSRACLLEADPEALDGMTQSLEKARRVFFDAEGREGLLLACYAMRLAHMGLAVHLAGEATAPVVTRGDALVACLPVGGGALAACRLELARRAGASTVAIVPAGANTGAAKEADRVFALPAAQDSPAFGRSLLLCLDGAVLAAMGRRGLTEAEMEARHTNLE